jgi:regulator of nonsense transcripts 3
MSTAVPSSPARSKSKKLKEKDKDHERKQLPGERLKIVVRRLPPNLPEDIFWQSVSNWVTDDTVAWKSYFPGKPKKRYDQRRVMMILCAYLLSMNKENIPSRAYIAFKDSEYLLIFSREFDGHKFVDKAGKIMSVLCGKSFEHVSQAMNRMQLSSLRHTKKCRERRRNLTLGMRPSKKVKRNAVDIILFSDTLADEDYISFIESLNVQSNAEPVTIETLGTVLSPPPTCGTY